MPAVHPRPLSAILNDLRTGHQPVTKKIAEEAIAAVAADGAITKEEADLMEPLSDRTVMVKAWKGEFTPGVAGAFIDWPNLKNGTLMGRALLDGLASIIEKEASKDRFERAHDSSPMAGFASLWSVALGGSSLDREEASSDTELREVGGSSLLQQAREASADWLESSIASLVSKYPKASDHRGSGGSEYKPALQARVDALTKKWLDGTLPDGDPAKGLKSFLDAHYR